MQKKNEPRRLIPSGRDDSRTINANCEVCTVKITIEQIAFGGTWLPSTLVCDQCIEKEHEKREVERLESIDQKYTNWYEARCPNSMLETEPDRLEQINLAKVMGYEMDNGRGLMLYGATGLGKTRMLWMLLRHLTIAKRFSQWLFYSSTSLARELTVAYSFDKTNLRQSPQELHQKLIDIPLLCIDDFGKERLTPRIESELFDIIRERTDELKPILFTSNFDGEKLIARFNDPYTAEPLIRRVREFCVGIHYK